MSTLEWVTYSERLKNKLTEAEEVLRQINAICHVPSHGRAAYSHFMADFDQIRKLTKPYL